MLAGMIVFIVAAVASAAAAQVSAEIEPNPDDVSAQTYAVPIVRLYTVRNTGADFVARLRGGPLASTRRQCPTIANLAQQQFQLTVLPGATSLTAASG